MSPPLSKQMLDAMTSFQRGMEKLGVGVSISINDEPPVVIVPPPADVIDLDAERAKRRSPSVA